MMHAASVKVQHSRNPLSSTHTTERCAVRSERPYFPRIAIFQKGIDPTRSGKEKRPQEREEEEDGSLKSHFYLSSVLTKIIHTDEKIGDCSNKVVWPRRLPKLRLI